jgi:hypothetical protein
MENISEHHTYDPLKLEEIDDKNTHLFTTPPKALYHLPAKLERKRRSWAIIWACD